MSNEFKCKFCDKLYSSASSRSNHYSLYHKSDVSQKLVKMANNVSQKLAILANNVNKVVISNDFKCNFCDNIYKHRSSKSKHEKTCKAKKEEKYKELENKVYQLEKIIKSKKNQKTSTTNTNNGTIINGNGNGIINNNNIHINGLGSENIIGKLTENEKINLITGLLFKEVPYVELIRKVYNDGKFLEDRNTMITNLQDLKIPSGACPCQTKTCFAYNKENNKFNAKNKNEQIDDIIDYRQKDIKDLYQEMQDNKKIKSNARKLIEDYIEKFDNLKNTESYRKNKEEIIYIIYNCKEIMRKLKDDLDILEDKSVEI